MQAHVNGTTIAWEERGTGEPLVLTHGLGESRAVWRRFQMAPLSAEYRVIAIDLRGFGESTLGTADGTPAQLAADVAALLRHLEIPSAAVLGFSAGGVIAMRLAVDYPALASALVVASSSCVVNRMAADFYEGQAALVEREGVDGFLRQPFPEGFLRDHHELEPAYREIQRGALRDPNGFVNAARAMTTLYTHPLTDELSGVGCPALALTGELDVRCPPKAARIIRDHIPGCQMEIIPGVPHLAHWENPALWNALLLEFLGSRLGKQLGE